MITEKTEYAEIIRRRLFDWQGLPEEGRRVAAAYAEGIRENARKMAGFDERELVGVKLRDEDGVHPIAAASIRRLHHPDQLKSAP